MAEVLVVSDTHLSEGTPEAVANWDAIVALADARQPALVLHLGDLSVDSPRHPEQLEFGRRQLDRLSVEWRALPGNHDIGDDPPPYLKGDEATDERRQRWVDAVGPDYWHVEAAGVHFVGIDAQLFGTGIGSERRQWEWLETTFRSIGTTEPVVVASHKPLDAAGPELQSMKSGRFVHAPSRPRLLGLLAGVDAGLVLSGHVHQYRDLVVGGRRHVWAPSAWAVVPDEVQAVVGTKRCGLLSVEMTGAGPGAVEMLEPDGVGQYTIGHEIPNPYAAIIAQATQESG